MNTITIDSYLIGHDAPVYIVAEAGFNHEGNLDTAERMIAAAADAGAHAIKFQSYRASDLVAEDSQHYATIQSGELSLDDHRRLFEAARQHDITLFSTPFSIECADMLEQVHAPAYKIASMDLTHLPLLTHVARKGKPLILSTGTGSLGEIEQALATVRAAGNEQIMLLHCVSEYPTPLEHCHLQVIPMLKTVFDVPIGLSDHTLGMSIPLAAVALGACVIEKHFTLDKSLPEPDHKLSADPRELRAFVQDAQSIQAGIGKGASLSDFFSHRPDAHMRRIIRRSLVAKNDIAEGATLTEAMFGYIRPGDHLGPEDASAMLGKTVRKPVKKGQPITWDAI